MATYTKTVAEGIGMAEKRLTAAQTYSEGQYVRRFILSNEYEDVESVETNWESEETIERK